MSLSAIKPRAGRAVPGAPPTAPRPNLDATVALIASLVVVGLTAHGGTPSAYARFAAVGVGVSLILSLALEFKKSWANLLRADLVALVALYFFLFFEFLFPQTRLNELSQRVEIEKGVSVCLWAFAAMAIGRHLLAGFSIKRWRIAEFEAPRGTMLGLFWGCFFLGYFHMLVAVDFNPVEMVNAFLEPRFTQPWTRGQFGDWRAMLYETGSVLFLVPSLAGVILGRRNHYSRVQSALVVMGFLFTLFYGFSTGTRNLIGSYLITFLVSLFYASGATLKVEVLVYSVLAAGVLLASVLYGIQFRDLGLANYLRGDRNAAAESELYIDYDLFVVSRLTTIFPTQKAYVGRAVPIWMLARPIPRVLWPGKPDGSNVSAESVLGEEGTTVSCTFVGEAYMSAGLLGVIIAALLVGFLAQWWTYKAYSLKSDFGVLIYGSGFFSVVISMRSMYMLPVAILPTLAIGLIGYWLMCHPSAPVRTKQKRPGKPRASPMRAVTRTSDAPIKPT